MRAGLGWIGRHAMIISLSNGPSQRVAAVYTSIANAPLTREHEHGWIPEFGDSCNWCVKSCPERAIYTEARAVGHGEQHVDLTKCAVAFSRTMGCSICIRDCPFFKLGYDPVQRVHQKRQQRSPGRRNSEQPSSKGSATDGTPGSHDESS